MTATNAIKSVALAAALVMSPVAASAFTVGSSNISVGDTVDVFAGPFFWDATFFDADDAGSVSFGFENTSATDITGAVSIGTILQSIGEFEGGVTVSFGSGGSDLRRRRRH